MQKKLLAISGMQWIGQSGMQREVAKDLPMKRAHIDHFIHNQQIRGSIPSLYSDA